jgi:hypothetical protein
MRMPGSILGASYLGPDGYGNLVQPLRPWPETLRPAFSTGDIASLHWELLFQSDPARFSRMDHLCRLGLMAVELLQANLDQLTDSVRENLGVFVETWSGSVSTDARFLKTPRASLFAYTLPSTVMGEICIRYRLRGPLLCLVKAAPDRTGVLPEALHWLQENPDDLALCVFAEAVDPEAIALAPLPEFKVPLWSAGALLLRRNEWADLLLDPPRGLPEICRSLAKG